MQHNSDDTPLADDYATLLRVVERIERLLRSFDTESLTDERVEFHIAIEEHLREARTISLAIWTDLAEAASAVPEHGERS